MSSKTTSNSTTNSTATQTPTNPSWVTQPLQGLTSRITALGQVPATDYVAGQTALQKQANAQGAATLSGTNPNYTRAAADINGSASVNPADISKWMSPYTNTVINGTNNLLQNQFGQQLAQNDAAGAAAGAFGGSRFGVQQGVLQGQQALDQGGIDAQLLNSGYQTAQQGAFANANLGQTAGQNLTNLGTSENASNIANIQELSGLGAAQQATNQSTATAPIALAQAMATLYGQNQFPLFNGQNATGTSNSNGTTTQSGMGPLLSGIGSAVGGAANLAAFF